MKKSSLLKKAPALTLALLMAGSALVCACSKSATPETTAEETTTEVTTEVTTEATTETTLPNGKDTTPYKEIVLDGKSDSIFVSNDFCYIECEKCVIFIEKDIKLPGDFAVNVNAIIGEIESQLQLSAFPEGYDYGNVIDISIRYDGFNPWKDWNIGEKIPVFMCVDRNDEHMISSASSSGAEFILYECFSDELWNSVDSYRENDWRRPDYVDYGTVAHELTHVITLRNGHGTMITTEGIAEYMGRTVVEALADKYPSIGEYVEKRYLYDESIPEAVNSGNAERIFTEDYNKIGHAERGAEYVYGRYLFQFLNEEFGDSFFKIFNDATVKAHLPDIYGNYDEGTAIRYAEVIKDTFGDDVFTRFGDWCVKNHALQELDGVWPGL